MSDTTKRIFLGICILLPFIAYCIYYYGIMINNAPYKFSEFESFKYQYGVGDSLINRYDSKTGVFQHLDKRDSLIKTTVKLNKDDLLYLHRKAAEQGFWNFPKYLLGRDTTASKKSQHIYIQYNYQRKSKDVLIDVEYNDDVKLRDAAKQLSDEISKMLSDVYDRGRK